MCSSGLHSNGFSLVRHLLKEHAIDLHSPFAVDNNPADVSDASVASIGDVLLTPTTIYSPVLRDLGEAVAVHAAAHITGGGFPDNVGRAIPDALAAELDLEAWSPAPVFRWIHALGVGESELLRTFNCGLGMVIALDASDAEPSLQVVRSHGLEAQIVGRVVDRAGEDAVRYRGNLRL